MDNNQPIDKSVVNLMKALKQHESGGDYTKPGASGEYGAYQYTEPTFKSYAKQYANLPNANLKNDADQDKVTYYAIKGMKDKGYTPEQVLSEWNSGNKDAYKENHRGVNKYGVAYDTPAYVEAVKKIALSQSQTPKAEASVSQETPEQPKNENGALFESKPGEDSAGMSALKTVGNLPSSLWGFTKGVISSLNPLNTLEKVSEIPGAFKDAKDEGVTMSDYLKEIPGAFYRTLVPKGIRQVISGDVEGAQKSFTEDPIGTVAPVVLAASGGLKSAADSEVAANTARTADYVKNIGDNVNKPIPQARTTFQDLNAGFDRGVSKTSGLITKPISAVAGKIGDLTGNFGVSMASHLTALDPATIRQILSDPKEFSKIAQEQTSRGGLAGEVQSAINSRIKDLSETGKGYEPIKAQTEMIPKTTSFVDDVIEQNGLRIDKNGKITADSMSTTRNPADIKAIQGFYDNWGRRVGLTPAEFMNMRSDLADLAKYDKLTGTGKTPKSQVISNQLYQEANKTFRPDVKGLKELDAKYSEETQFLKQVKKDYFNRDGTFKDNAPSRIANAGNKAELLKRLENIVPGITKRIEILKAVEDIDTAMGRKVGTYTRGILQGGAILSGNMPAIIATIITHPTNAVRILRAAGYTASSVGPVVNALRMIGGGIGEVPRQAGLISNQSKQLQD